MPGPRRAHRAHMRGRGDLRGLLHDAQLAARFEQAKIVQEMRQRDELVRRHRALAHFGAHAVDPADQLQIELGIAAEMIVDARATFDHAGQDVVDVVDRERIVEAVFARPRLRCRRARRPSARARRRARGRRGSSRPARGRESARAPRRARGSPRDSGNRCPGDRDSANRCCARVRERRARSRSRRVRPCASAAGGAARTPSFRSSGSCRRRWKAARVSSGGPGLNARSRARCAAASSRRAAAARRRARTRALR